MKRIYLVIVFGVTFLAVTGSGACLGLETSGAVLPLVIASADELVDLDVREADLRDAMMQVARKANINVIVSPKVQGKLTCRVTRMDPRELILFIARTNNLVVENHGNIMIIMAGESPGRNVRFEVISLQYADSAEVAKIIQNLKLDKRVQVTHDQRTNRLILIYNE